MREIKFGKPMIDENERRVVEEVLKGDILVHGPRAKEFEREFSSFTKGGHSVSVSSCTAGLHLSYFHFGIGKEDEVIVPAQSHVATVHAVELVGATPIFVDAELKTGNIDIDQIEDRINEKTKAVSLVHYLGMPVDMDRILAIASKHQLKVIEDCALGIGSKFKGKHVGLFGDAGCFSFYPVKHFTTAEGGMILCKDEEDSTLLTRKKAFGVDRTDSERKVPGIYEVTMLGFNYRMNEIQAAIGVEQLKKIQSFLDIREKNYIQLEKGLQEIEEINLFQSSYGDFTSSHYCLSIVLNEELAKKRFEIVKYLNENGVGTSVYYPKAIPEFEYYREKYGYKPGQFANASRISNRSIALPVAPHLNEEDMNYIVEKVKKSIKSI